LQTESKNTSIISSVRYSSSVPCRRFEGRRSHWIGSFESSRGSIILRNFRLSKLDGCCKVSDSKLNSINGADGYLKERASPSEEVLQVLNSWLNSDSARMHCRDDLILGLDGSNGYPCVKEPMIGPLDLVN
jgi:hypothetical protein